MQTAGVILDIYDDPSGRILREKTAKAPLPEKLKTASLLSPDELGQIPDRLFALVAQDGDKTLRKYAMHDEAHLATSIIYFLECGHLLPKVAQDVAATNLAAACDWYDLTVPEPLMKRAGLGRMLMGAGIAAGTASEVKAGMQQKKQEMDRHRWAQATGMVIPPAGEQKHASDDGPSDDLEAILFSKNKAADLTGTEIMTHQETNRGKRIRPSAPKTAVATSSKNASIDFVDPHVDITGLTAPPVVKQASYENFCLGDRYPIDTYGQVKQAAAYFEEHCHAFDLPSRRTYAVNLVKRANDLGIPIGGRVLDYAGFHYGPHVMAELQKRAGNFAEPEKQAVYLDLREKVAHGLDPQIAATAMAQADQAFGLDQYYDKPVVGFRDPFAAVYGVKTASEQITGLDDAAKQERPAEARGFAWNEGADYVNEDMLFQAAETQLKTVEEMFGEGFAKDFAKDPVGTFKSMPDPQKHAIARLASDNSGGSYRS